MLTFLAISTGMVLAYLVYSTKVSGSIPVSLSATYYALGKHKWLFPLFMAMFAVLLYPVWFTASQAEHQCLVFLSCASLLFVASSPCFREELQGKVHYSSAIVCCICTVLWQVLEGLWDITIYFAWIGGILSLVWRKQWCWWVECAVVGSLLANLWRLV